MQDHWHISRSVPISVLAVVLVQSALFIWWLAGIVNKVENQADKTKEILSQLTIVSSSVASSSAQSAINTVEIATLKTQISELRGRLDFVQAEQARRTSMFPDSKKAN